MTTLYSMPIHTDALTATAVLLYYNNLAKQERSKMLNALWIVLLGMAIIFAVLGILLLVMILLGKLVKPRKKEEKKG
jgi:uncharacterized iron-regulated membrane protein